MLAIDPDRSAGCRATRWRGATTPAGQPASRPTGQRAQPRGVSMVSVREPVLHPVPIKSLRPTQITVGMIEVEEKRKRWREHGEKKKGEFLGKHMIPVILGPKERHYVIDHHHLARALHEEGVKDVLVTIVTDLRELDQDAFWTVLDHRAWT